MAKEIDRPMKAKGVVHKQIAETAKALAREQWEQLAKQNAFYKSEPDVNRFVRRHWDKYIPMVREMFALMLGNPAYSDEMKSQIQEALLLDGAINPKQMAAPAKPVFTFGNLKKEPAQ